MKPKQILFFTEKSTFYIREVRKVKFWWKIQLTGEFQFVLVTFVAVYMIFVLGWVHPCPKRNTTQNSRIFFSRSNHRLAQQTAKCLNFPKIERFVFNRYRTVYSAAFVSPKAPGMKSLM